MYGTNNKAPQYVVFSSLWWSNTNLSPQSVFYSDKYRLVIAAVSTRSHWPVLYPAEPQVAWSPAFSFALRVWESILWPKIWHWVGEYVNGKFIHKPTADVSEFPVHIGVPGSDRALLRGRWCVLRWVDGQTGIWKAFSVTHIFLSLILFSFLNPPDPLFFTVRRGR
jgi:hypothetical protein